MSLVEPNLRSFPRLAFASFANRQTPVLVPNRDRSLIQSSLIVVSPWIIAASIAFR